MQMTTAVEWFVAMGPGRKKAEVYLQQATALAGKVDYDTLRPIIYAARWHIEISPRFERLRDAIPQSLREIHKEGWRIALMALEHFKAWTLSDFVRAGICLYEDQIANHAIGPIGGVSAVVGDYLHNALHNEFPGCTKEKARHYMWGLLGYAAPMEISSRDVRGRVARLYYALDIKYDGDAKEYTFSNRYLMSELEALLRWTCRFQPTLFEEYDGPWPSVPVQHPTELGAWLQGPQQ